MSVVAGVDASARGWVWIRLRDGTFDGAALHASFADGLSTCDDAVAIGVDMPLGYPLEPARTRAADTEARRRLGRRASTVFHVPPRAVLQAPDWAAANRLSKSLSGRGLARQSFALASKILELEPFALADARIREVHPEVSFHALAGRPIDSTKRQWNGLAQRRSLLAGAGIEIPDDLGDAGLTAADDVLDAAIVAWTAARIANRTAESLPEPPQRDVHGRAIAIWY